MFILRELWRARSVIKYIFFELLPSFCIGVVVFVSILLTFQALRLTEFVLVHGVSTETVLDIAAYLTVSFLPVIFPMSVLFSVLLTYGRLAADSEIIALKAAGLHILQIGLPALVLGLLAFLASAQTSFQLAPWGNRQFELLISDLQRTKTSTTIRAGVFSEGFFDLVVYANQVNTETGELQKVFIYDERDPESPLTIIASQGELMADPLEPKIRQLLRLHRGNIHRTSASAYTKIDFDTYDINLSETPDESIKKKSALSYNYSDLLEAFGQPDLDKNLMRNLTIEWHRRWALAVACLIFAFVGVALATGGNRRSGKSNGLTLSIMVCVSYWMLYIMLESTAKAGTLPIWLAIWLCNGIFFAFGVWRLRKS